jgi:lipase
VARSLDGAAGLLAVDLRGRGASSALPPPYGMEAYTRDMLAVLDRCGIERAVLVGHSLGAYAVARFAADRPERVRAAVLVDGGLTLPEIEGVDPDAFLEAFLGPALARLELEFGTREEYHRWWRSHPAFAGPDVAEADLVAYADHDLGGESPHLRSTVARDAVRTDAHELFEIGKPAHRLTVPTEMLRAPRGLQNEPNPMIPAGLASAWAAAAPEHRRVSEVADVNHYTIVMGATGARAVAQAIVRAGAIPASDPPLRSAR